MLGGQELYQGRSVHIGLNRVNPEAYGGWSGELMGCVNDAEALCSLAQGQGYQAALLLNEEATRERVVEEILAAREALWPSDVFLLTYSGHGGQVPDPEHEEADHLDETWCLFDGELLDDELFVLWQGFPERARIVVVSDSCHAGGMVRAGSPWWSLRKNLPAAWVHAAHKAQRGLYDGVPRQGREKYDLEASLCLLSACQENQVAYDGVKHGLFTGRLLEAWLGGAFEGDYWQLHRVLLRKMPAYQSPGLLFVGCRNLGFEWSRALAIR